MITKLSLKNWKSHLNSEFSFAPGVNALVGIMGSGKSSVTDAIAFALFGTFPAVQTRKVLLDGLLMERPQPRDGAAVTLEFQVGEKQYQVRREIIRGKGSSAEIRENGELREVGATGVTKEVERILSMDYDVFSKAVYAEQNGIDYFLKIPSGKRREHIDRMLRVDRYELVRGEAKSLANKLHAVIEERARVVADLENDQLEKRYEAAAKEVETLRQQHQHLEQQQSQLTEKRAAVEAQVKAGEEQQQTRERTQRVLEGVKGGIQEVMQQEGRNRKIVRGKDLGAIDKELATLGQQIELRKKDRDTHLQAISEAETRKQVAEEDLAALQDVEGACPVCTQVIAPGKKASLVATKEDERSQREKELATLTQHAEEKGKEITFLENTLADKRVERERVSAAYQEIKTLEEKFQELQATQQRYEQELAAAAPAQDLAAAREQLQDAVSAERSRLVELRDLDARVREKKLLLDDLAERVARLTTYREEIGNDREVITDLQRFETALKTTQDVLRTTFLEQVNQLLATVWKQLYPYDDFTAVRLAVEGGDYALQLKTGEWKDAEAVSGGERSLACLALRIGFSLAFLPGLRWLILDEPTHNLDSTAIATFGEALRETLPQFAQQIFLITHDPALSEGLQTVYRLERDKAVGEPTRVVTG